MNEKKIVYIADDNECSAEVEQVLKEKYDVTRLFKYDDATKVKDVSLFVLDEEVDGLSIEYYIHNRGNYGLSNVKMLLLFEKEYNQRFFHNRWYNTLMKKTEPDLVSKVKMLFKGRRV